MMGSVAWRPEPGRLTATLVRSPRIPDHRYARVVRGRTLHPLHESTLSVNEGSLEPSLPAFLPLPCSRFRPWRRP